MYKVATDLVTSNLIIFIKFKALAKSFNYMILKRFQRRSPGYIGSREREREREIGLDILRDPQVPRQIAE